MLKGDINLYNKPLETNQKHYTLVNKYYKHLT